MDEASQARADRLHAALTTTFEGFLGALDGASFERRAGHSRLLFPAVPIRIFNGVVVESEPCPGVADSIREVEEHGVPCGVQIRAGRHPAVEEEAARLGLDARTQMPGMAASADELAEARAAGLELVRVEDAEGLEAAAQVAAAGSGAPVELLRPVYAPATLELDGFAVYLGIAGGETVTTAIGYRTGAEVAVFSVATPPEHRRRGYGAGVTAHAAREAFAAGADLAWLQTSELGEPVYRGLGFRHVEMHLMLRRPDTGPA